MKINVQCSQRAYRFFFVMCGLALFGISGPAEAGMESEAPLYRGEKQGCNAGVVTTSENHLECETKPIGYTIKGSSIDVNSGISSAEYVELYSGRVQGTNAGVVTTSSMHLDGTTKPIGFISKRPIPGGTQLFVGVQNQCNKGVVTTNSEHKNCSTESIGWTMP